MSSTTTILIPLLVGFGFLYWSSVISDDEEILKLILRLFFIPSAWLSLHLATIYASLDYLGDVELVETLANNTLYLSWLLYIIGFYYIFMIIGKCYTAIMSYVAQKKEEKYA